MADKKISALNALVTSNGNDLLVIIDDPLGTPVSKKITLNNFFGAIPSNTSISGTFTCTANVTFSGANTVISSNTNFSASPKISTGVITLTGKSTVSSNNATTQLGGGGLQGSLFWDDNYLYVATSNTVVKRVALSTFAS